MKKMLVRALTAFLICFLVYAVIVWWVDVSGEPARQFCESIQIAEQLDQVVSRAREGGFDVRRSDQVKNGAITVGFSVKPNSEAVCRVQAAEGKVIAAKFVQFL